MDGQRIDLRKLCTAFSKELLDNLPLLLGQVGAKQLRVPLSPFVDDLPDRLDGTPVLIIDGENDGRRSPGDGLRLAQRLIHVGATVTHHVLPIGHSITAEDRRIASEWLRATML
ncbi:MAG TPA: hypothetical protein VMD98_14105 [Bryocella sp.]|nr:hypothetical protein [Bryocella sp.]